MPRVIRGFRFRPVTNQAYPWSEWLDGRVREFKRPRDFRVETASFVAAARGWAVRHGFNVRASVRGNTVTMQALLGKSVRRKA